MTIYITGYGKAKLSFATLAPPKSRWLAEWERDDVPGYGYGATIEAAITALTEWK